MTSVETGISDAMERLISYLSPDFPTEAKTICIKPNLCEYRTRETAATTDPLVLDPLLGSLKRRFPNAKFYLIENDATGVNADNVFPFLGLDAVAKKYDAVTANVGREDWTAKSIDGMRFKRVDVPAILQKCDMFVTHPKLKTHGATKITCGLKNQFGLLKPKNKLKYHSFLDEAIVDANIAMKPDLSIVDANICMEGNGGPLNGAPKRLGLLIGGTDVVSVDAFCSKLIGFRPRFVGHIRKAAKMKVGEMGFYARPDFDMGCLKKYRFEFSMFWYYVLKLARKKLARSR